MKPLKNLKRREPFKSAGDLRSRLKRFKSTLIKDSRISNEIVIFAWPPKGAHTVDEVLISQLTYDEAFEILSILKSRGDIDLSTLDLKHFVEARLNLIKKRPETFEAQLAAIKSELSWLLGIDGEKFDAWLADGLAGRAGMAELEAIVGKK